MLLADQASRLVSITPDEARALNLPELDFKPFMLRPWFLFSSLMFNIFILGLMVTLIFKPRFRVLSQWGYFFVQIFPAVIGTITASFLHGITMNLSRLAPFMRCAAPSGSTAGRTILREYFPDPSIRDAFGAKNYTLIFAWILFILGNFILGFKASLLNTDMTDGYREAIVSTWALYPLIAIYSLVALFMLVVIIRMRAAGSTGLLWDPVSLADHLVLFRHSNILKHFERTDMATRESMFKVLREIPLKLGYWKWTEGNATRYWHGFGIPESVENGISVLPSRISQSPVRKCKPQSHFINVGDSKLIVISIPQVSTRASISRHIQQHGASFQVHLDDDGIHSLRTFHSRTVYEHGQRLRNTIFCKLGCVSIPVCAHGSRPAFHLVLGGSRSLHPIHTTFHVAKTSTRIRKSITGLQLCTPVYSHIYCTSK